MKNKLIKKRSWAGNIFINGFKIIAIRSQSVRDIKGNYLLYTELKEKAENDRKRNQKNLSISLNYTSQNNSKSKDLEIN